MSDTPTVDAPRVADDRRPAGRNVVVTALADARVLVGRSLRMSLRNVEAMITALALPVMLMVMFVYLFGGAIGVGVRYVDFVVPGVLLVCIGFGAGTTAVSVAQDMSTGIIDRFRSMDVRGEALLTGHVVAGVARNIISTALVIGVAFAIGFRSSAGPARWLGALSILVLFMVALAWLAAAIGMLAGSPEAASGFTFFLGFLPYPSSALVPVATMPSWLQGFARHQPVTAVIDTVRALLLGQSPGADAWPAVAWSVAIAGGSMAVVGAVFSRRVQ